MGHRTVLSVPAWMYFLVVPGVMTWGAAWLALTPDWRRLAFGMVIGAWLADVMFEATLLYLLAHELGDG
jgi:hypothetical protein